MKKSYILLLLSFILFYSCKTPQPSVTTIVNRVDSTVITYKDSLVEVPVPVEKIVDIANLLDTLTMETSMAKAQAWVDTTTNTLKGSLENKDTTIGKTVYLPSKEKIVYRDSIQEKEIPVEVIVEKKVTPKWVWWILSGLLVFVGWSYRKWFVKLFKIVAAMF